MGFDLSKYETVEDRLARFWIDHPAGRIATSMVFYDDNRVVFRAEAYFVSFEDLYPAGVGHAEEIRGASPVNKTSHVENCETSAIGRALANCNYAPKGARPSREEMVKANRGAVVQEPLTVDLLTKFRDACKRANILAEDVAKKANIDINALQDSDMPKLRDAFKSMQEQAKVVVPVETSTVVENIEKLVEAFPGSVIEPQVKEPKSNASNAQIGKLRAMLNAAGFNERNTQADAVSEILNRRVEKLDFLKKGEADTVIKVLISRQNR